ncbi:MAG: NADH-quinone oxidoreductase subunit N, partial [Proteobacteria bacterium]|nr:NADH-quinone oxidoreductase subunit N [Pseudomonadota bacterium]
MPNFDPAKLDYVLLAPQFIVTGLIFVCLSLDLMVYGRGHRFIGWVAIMGLAVGIGAQASLWGVRSSFAGVLRVDDYSNLFNIIFMAAGIGVVFLSFDYAERFFTQPGEFYAFLVAGVLGMGLMAQAQELLTAYIALELLSFSSYVLVSYAKTNLKSNEAGLKYIILGSFSSAILLYGVSLLFGAVGSTMFTDIRAALGTSVATSAVAQIALIMITAGLAFKVAAVPFHMYSPDVYEGAPTPITAFLSVASKAAGFALTMRFVVMALWPLRGPVSDVIAFLAILTMTLGNVVALRQTNIKRLMAYSSIAQAGYALIGVAAFFAAGDIAEQASRGVILQLIGYLFTTLAAFGGIIAFQVVADGKENISDLAGLSRRSPFAAFAIMSALFSLAGMPIFSGFMTKLFLFAPVARADLLWLVGIAVLNSTISLYYYLQVIRVMYSESPAGVTAMNASAVAAIGSGADAFGDDNDPYWPPISTVDLGN